MFEALGSQLFASGYDLSALGCVLWVLFLGPCALGFGYMALGSGLRALGLVFSALGFGI